LLDDTRGTHLTSPLLPSSSSPRLAIAFIWFHSPIATASVAAKRKMRRYVRPEAKRSRWRR
jgi:hypothetical protein